jgi:LysR family carnitine catabolism transcriptional activator
MNVSLKQLQAFVAVARSQSFAEACGRIHLSQPALSIAIKNLEESVGGRLLARTTRSVTLTPEGEAFYPVVKRLLADWDQSLEDVHNMFSLQRGKLDIAAVPTFASSLLPDILAIYHQHYADINVTVHDVITETVVDMVRNGRVELGVTFDPGDADELFFEPLFTDNFMVVLPLDHPLLVKSTLSWEDLEGYPFINLQRPSSIRLLIDEVIAEHNYSLSPTFEAHQLASIGRMVSAGLGVSVVPELSANQIKAMGAEYRPLTGPAISRQVGVITRKRAPLSAATEAMLEVIAEWVQLNKKA